MFMPVEKDNDVPILFKITIDTNLKNTKPYANISGLSQYPDEEEILFMLGTIFQIRDVQINNKTNTRTVLLDICNEDNQDFKAIFSYENEKLGEYTRTMLQLCSLFYRVGDYNRCQKYYEKYVREHPEDAFFYLIMCAVVNMAQYKFDIAMTYFQKADKLLAENDYVTNMINRFLNEHFNKNQSDLYILEAAHYTSKEDFDSALASYNKVLELQINYLPPDHPSIATTYYSIGGCYCMLQQYQEGLKYLEKSLDIRFKSLPSAHKTICESLNMIANVYELIGDNETALEYYTISQSIAQESNFNIDPRFQFALDRQINNCKVKVLENQSIN